MGLPDAYDSCALSSVGCAVARVVMDAALAGDMQAASASAPVCDTFGAVIANGRVCTVDGPVALHCLLDWISDGTARGTASLAEHQAKRLNGRSVLTLAHGNDSVRQFLCGQAPIRGVAVSTTFRLAGPNDPLA